MEIKGEYGEAEQNGITVGNIRRWKLYFDDILNFEAEEYFLNRFWYMPQRWLEIKLMSARGYWKVIAKPQNQVKLGSLVKQKITFNIKEEVKFIRR